MGITSSTLRTRRLAFAARSVGEGDLVLFLHGITAGAVVWDPVIAELGRHFRCVAVDQRGHGHSEKPLTGYRAEDYVADVAAILDELGPARAVVGHSLGARNAILAGAAMPERVGAVVAVDYAAGIEPEVFEQLRAARAGGDGVLADLDDARRAVRSRSPLLPEAAVERRVQHLFSIADGACSPLAAPSAVDQTVEAMDVDLTGPLRESRMPVLVVRGAQSPFLSPVAYRLTLGLRHGIEGAVVPGTDHFVPEEAPHDLAALVRVFLAR